jgi:hypothetical protein
MRRVADAEGEESIAIRQKSGGRLGKDIGRELQIGVANKCGAICS